MFCRRAGCTRAGGRGGYRAGSWTARFMGLHIVGRLWLEADADVGVFEGIVWSTDNDCTAELASPVGRMS